jgi:hypothetical protein
VLESRLIGYDITITPLGSRLSVAGAIQAVLAHEDHLPVGTAIDTLISSDIRSKRVPKVPGKPVSFTSFHHDLDEIVAMVPGSVAFGHSLHEPFIAITIPPDGTAAVQYSIDVLFHWEVAGTTVAQVSTPNLHDAPLLESIHHAASQLHSELQGQYLEPSKAADHIAKKTTGFSFSSLLTAASSVANFIGGAGKFAGAAESIGMGMIESALPTIAEFAPLALML